MKVWILEQFQQTLACKLNARPGINFLQVTSNNWKPCCCRGASPMHVQILCTQLSMHSAWCLDNYCLSRVHICQLHYSVHALVDVDHQGPILARLAICRVWMKHVYTSMHVSMNLHVYSSLLSQWDNDHPGTPWDHVAMAWSLLYIIIYSVRPWANLVQTGQNFNYRSTRNLLVKSYRFLWAPCLSTYSLVPHPSCNAWLLWFTACALFTLAQTKINLYMQPPRPK